MIESIYMFLQMKKFLPLLIIPLLLAGLFAGLSATQKSQELRKKASVTGSTLSIQPAQNNVTVGDTLTISVSIDTGDDTVSAAELHINYDASKMEGQSITAGSYLPVILTSGQVGGGTASITLGSQPTDPKKGNGILATVKFKALNASSSQLTLTADTQVAAIGKAGNTMAALNPGQVTVNNVVGPTLTPGPTDIPSATPMHTLTPTVTSIPTISALCVVPRPCLFYSIPCTEPTPPQGYCPTPPPPNLTLSPLPSLPITPIASCLKKNLGDANCDGNIDGIDYSLWLHNQCHPTLSQKCSDLSADFNIDGNVDDQDYAIWLQNRQS